MLALFLLLMAEQISIDSGRMKYCIYNKKRYRPKDELIMLTNPCVKKSCRSGIFIDLHHIKCKALSCNEFGQTKLEKDCCEVCKSDTCKKNQVYNIGCEKICYDGPDKKCKTETEGCWCKDGYLSNEQGECIPSNECNCKVDSKIYRPSYWVTKSNCETCVCWRGAMNCMNKC